MTNLINMYTLNVCNVLYHLYLNKAEIETETDDSDTVSMLIFLRLLHLCLHVRLTCRFYLFTACVGFGIKLCLFYKVNWEVSHLGLLA